MRNNARRVVCEANSCQHNKDNACEDSEVKIRCDGHCARYSEKELTDYDKMKRGFESDR